MGTIYKTKKITQNVHVITAQGVMMFLITGSKSALLVDTGYGIEDPHDAIRSITKLPFAVINSHGHIDHAGGNHFFKDEEVYMHPADLDTFRRHTSPEYRKIGADSLRAIQAYVPQLALLPSNFDEKSYLRATDDASRYKKAYEGQRFELGDVSVSICELPGHTKGSIGFMIEPGRLLITSDAANPNTWLFLPESEPLSVYRKTLHKIAAMDFDHLLTGHTDTLFVRKDLNDWIAVAERPDWEGGKAQEDNPMGDGGETKACGETGNPDNKAVITISKEKLTQ